MDRAQESNARSIVNVEQLEEELSRPWEGVVRTIGQMEGDIIILGAGGKIGPSLARMAKRASDAAGVRRRIIGASVFTSDAEEAKLRDSGVEVISCDMLDEAQLADLPDAPNVIYMAGMKFGTTGKQALTWAVNVFLPGVVCRRYRSSRIVAFSTGNVYGTVPVDSGGSVETDTPDPKGEYAMSALGRERIFEYFSESLGTPVAVIRLNYAIDLRYGVLVDIAQRVFTGEPVDVTMGRVNVIWQGDANAMVLMALGHAASPAIALNVAGEEHLSVRDIAERFGEIMGKPVVFTGEEAADSLLSNSKLSYELFGRPRVNADRMISWVADWIMRGAETLGKPTHFETRDGKY